MGPGTLARNAALAVGVVAFAGVAWLLLMDAADHPDPIARGAAVYAGNCVSCHGAKLEGQPDWKHVNAAGRLPAPPLDGTGHGWRHSDAELFHFVKFSVLDEAGPDYQTDMPAFSSKLSDEDILAAIAFIKSRWPSSIQAAQSFLNPDHAGMPAHLDSDWRLPPDCDEPLRGKKPPANP
jgi:mono/diheme cytochrome c family protein